MNYLIRNDRMVNLQENYRYRKRQPYRSFFIAIVATSMSIVFINPLLALAGSCAFLLVILSVTRRNDTLRNVSLAIITALVCFNVLKNNVSILVGLIAVYLLVYLVDQRFRNVSKGKSELFFLAWLVYALLQTTWSVQTERIWLHIQVLTLGVAVIWFMGRMIATKELLGSFYKWWGFALFGTLVVAWWEVTTNHHFSRSGALFYNLQDVATVGFFNPNDYSFFLLISLPVIFHWIKQNAFYRFPGVLMLISAFYITYLNGARFLMMLFLLALAAFLISLARNRKKLFTFFIAAVAATGFFYFDVTMQAVGDASSLSQSDESSSTRKLLSIAALNIFQDYPLGVGSGNLEYYMVEHGLTVNGIITVHNFWLEVLANYGIFVFVGFVSFLAISVYKMFGAVKKSDSLRNVITPLLWSSVIFIPACLESSSIFTFSITWFLFGAMICAVNVIKQEIDA